MHPRNRLMMVPLVLGVGFGKLPAQANKAVEKDKMEIIDNFSAPSEVENQANQDYNRIVEILASISWDDREDFYNKKDEIQRIQQKGANSVAKINSPEKEDRLVDAYYKAIDYKLYSDFNGILWRIKHSLDLEEYKDLAYWYAYLLSTYSSASRDDEKKLDIDWQEIEKLFKKADPNILKLTKYEIEEIIKMMEQGGDEAFVSKRHFEKMDYMIYFIERATRLAEEQIDRLEWYDARASLPSQYLIFWFVLGWLITGMLLKFKSLVNFLADVEKIIQTRKAIIKKLQLEELSDGEQPLSEEQKQEKIEQAKQWDSEYRQALREKFPEEAQYFDILDKELLQKPELFSYDVDEMGEVIKTFHTINLSFKEPDLSGLPADQVEQYKAEECMSSLEDKPAGQKIRTELTRKALWYTQDDWIEVPQSEEVKQLIDMQNLAWFTASDERMKRLSDYLVEIVKSSKSENKPTQLIGVTTRNLLQMFARGAVWCYYENVSYEGVGILEKPVYIGDKYFRVNGKPMKMIQAVYMNENYQWSGWLSYDWSATLVLSREN